MPAQRKYRAKRVYEEAAPEDGARFLVERLWPRGMTKAAVAADQWLKEIAPSPELRKWYSHELERWPEFRRRYLEELKQNDAALEPIRAAARRGPVTLLYSVRDGEHSSAAVLKEYLEEHG